MAKGSGVGNVITGVVLIVVAVLLYEYYRSGKLFTLFGVGGTSSGGMGGSGSPTPPATKTVSETGGTADNTPSSPSPYGGAGTYTVKKGDSLWAIAQRFGVTLGALEGANPQISNPNLIYPGETIHLPGGAGTGGSSVSVPASPPASSSSSTGGNPQTFRGVPKNPQTGGFNLPYSGPVPSGRVYGGAGIYTVQKGDSLWSIAKRFGMNLQALEAANRNLPNPNLIYPGEKIAIPWFFPPKSVSGADVSSAVTSPPAQSSTEPAWLKTNYGLGAPNRPQVYTPPARSNEPSFFWAGGREVRITRGMYSQVQNWNPRTGGTITYGGTRYYVPAAWMHP